MSENQPPSEPSHSNEPAIQPPPIPPAGAADTPSGTAPTPPPPTQSGGGTDPAAAAPAPPPEVETEADKPWWRRILG
jgi:hypothetical protein